MPRGRQCLRPTLIDTTSHHPSDPQPSSPEKVFWSRIRMKSSWFESAAPGASVAATADLPNPFNEPGGTKICQSIRKGGGLSVFETFKIDAE